MGTIEKFTKAQLNYALEKSWSLQSSSKWSAENPSKGQCGVTTLVLNWWRNTQNSLI